MPLSSYKILGLSLLLAVVATSIALFFLQRKYRKASDKLTATQELFDLALKGSMAGLWDWNFKTNAMRFSQRWQEMLGYSDADGINSYDTWRELIHPDDVPRVMQAMANFLLGESDTFNVDHRVRHKSGEYYWMLNRGSCQRDITGQPVRVAGWQIDIRSFREKDEILAEEKLRFDLITANIGDVIWMMDVDRSRLHYVSHGYERVWERSAKFLYDDPRSIVETIHPEDRARVVAAFATQGEGKYRETFRIVTPNGKVKWVLDRAFPIYSDHGGVVRIVGLTTDITEQVLRERIVEEQRAKLVATARLSSLGEMAGGVAHEINNPLAIIRGHASLLLKRLETSEEISIDRLWEGLKKIDSTCERIYKIIRGLKTFSQSGDKQPMAPIELKDLLTDTLELCRERFRNKGILLKIQEPVPSDVFEGRTIQLSQVLLNLLNNAFDAAADTEDPWIELSFVVDANFVQLIVSDSGAGIPADIADKIMQPFFTTKELGRGTGLGLSISLGIVEDHGGRLELDRTSPNTKFVVTLPKKRVKAVEAQAA